jgi:FkbM family methyltransferase
MFKEIKIFLKLYFRVYRKLIRFLNRIFIEEPDLTVLQHEFKLKRLGTAYGGWTFVDHEKLHNSIVISCGLGEDASFDVEFASLYGARVIIVDPTPRAIEHFHKLMKRIGHFGSSVYGQNGRIDVEVYDLSKVSSSQLLLCEKAVWIEETVLKFFMPSDKKHVSHSLVNFQNNYIKTTESIDVGTTTIDELLAKFNVVIPDIIKFDIEGAEVEVLLDMIMKKIYPPQILVEYDELLVPSRIGMKRIDRAHKALIDSGYLLLNREHTNFLYVQPKAIALNCTNENVERT